MTRFAPKFNEKWQHYKGHKYHILGISSYSKIVPSTSALFWAQHTEALNTLCVYAFTGCQPIEYETDGQIEVVQSHLLLTLIDRLTIIGTPHVIYVGETPGTWARPLSMFMSKVGELDCYRFKNLSEK